MNDFQKMELGVLLLNCPCLSQDLDALFNSYWELSTIDSDTNMEKAIGNIAHKRKPIYNSEKPLTINYQGTATQMYLAVG